MDSTCTLKIKYLKNIRFTKVYLLPYFCLGLEPFNYRPSFFKFQSHPHKMLNYVQSAVKFDVVHPVYEQEYLTNNKILSLNVEYW